MEELQLYPSTVLAVESKNRRGRLDVRRPVDGEGGPLDGDPRQRLLARVSRRGGASSHPCDGHHPRPRHHALPTSRSSEGQQENPNGGNRNKNSRNDSGKRRRLQAGSPRSSRRIFWDPEQAAATDPERRRQPMLPLLPMLLLP
ncbi:hypothetical protein ZWY2020_040985 [Hordeum vulgare]|nr:hypothetical protein ZWY2020_040985 [Hordeum vulgare]